MADEKTNKLSEIMEKVFDIKLKQTTITPEFIKYELILDNASAIIQFDIKIIDNKSIDELEEYLNNLDLPLKLKNTDNNILIINN